MPKTIKMLRDMRVAQDGFTVENWKKDEIHEDVEDVLADDLIHPQTLAAIEVTGNKRVDEKAELDALAEQERRDKEAAAAATLSAAAETAALAAVGSSAAPVGA